MFMLILLFMVILSVCICIARRPRRLFETRRLLEYHHHHHERAPGWSVAVFFHELSPLEHGPQKPSIHYRPSVYLGPGI